MSRKSKNRISTEHENSLSAANPFTEISVENLPKNPSSTFERVSVARQETKSKGRVDIIREKSGRAGKTVTVLRGFSETISSEELESLTLKLKKHCACGGSFKERTIELQGDACKQVMRELEKLDFRPIRCGG